MSFDRALLDQMRTDYAPRHFRFKGLDTESGILVKEYEISTTPSGIPDAEWETARNLMKQFASDPLPYARAGIGVTIFHRGADGDYVLLLEWISGYMSSMRIFLRTAANEAFVPASEGLAPCVWERAIFSHENTAYHRLLTSSEPELDIALNTWKSDVFTGVW